MAGEAGDATVEGTSANMVLQFLFKFFIVVVLKRCCCFYCCCFCCCCFFFVPTVVTAVAVVWYVGKGAAVISGALDFVLSPVNSLAVAVVASGDAAADVMSVLVPLMLLLL